MNGEPPERCDVKVDVRDNIEFYICQSCHDAYFSVEQGYWTEHPDFPREDWAHEAAEGNTGKSYADWLFTQLEERDGEC